MLFLYICTLVGFVDKHVRNENDDTLWAWALKVEVVLGTSMIGPN